MESTEKIYVGAEISREDVIRSEFEGQVCLRLTQGADSREISERLFAFSVTGFPHKKGELVIKEGETLIFRGPQEFLEAYQKEDYPRECWDWLSPKQQAVMGLILGGMYRKLTSLWGIGWLDNRIRLRGITVEDIRAVQFEECV